MLQKNTKLKCIFLTIFLQFTPNAGQNHDFNLNLKIAVGSDNTQDSVYEGSSTNHRIKTRAVDYANQVIYKFEDIGCYLVYNAMPGEYAINMRAKVDSALNYCKFRKLTVCRDKNCKLDCPDKNKVISNGCAEDEIYDCGISNYNPKTGELEGRMFITKYGPTRTRNRPGREIIFCEDTHDPKKRNTRENVDIAKDLKKINTVTEAVVELYRDKNFDCYYVIDVQPDLVYDKIQLEPRIPPNYCSFRNSESCQDQDIDCYMNCPKKNKVSLSSCAADPIYKCDSTYVNSAEGADERRLYVTIKGRTNKGQGIWSPNKTDIFCAFKRKPVCNCGYKTKRKDKTNRATEPGYVENEYPMLAAIGGYNGTGDIAVYCQGIIIGKQHVLTASSCNTGLFTKYVVVVGPFRIKKELTQDAYRLPILDESNKDEIRIYDVAHYLHHHKLRYIREKNYDFVNFDVTMLYLDASIQFNGKVGPACLPFKFVDQDLTGYNFTLLGWNNMESFRNSGRLSKLDLSVTTQTECNKRYNRAFNQLCVHAQDFGKWQVSGGGIFYTDPETDRLHLMGLTSYLRFEPYKKNNQKLPWYFTSVISALDWIEGKAQSDYCRI